jgi:Tfp pilus assembly protein PilX
MTRNRRTQRRERRPGAALVIALVGLLLVTTISAVLMRLALTQRHQLEREARRQQADWLALSGLQRAIARSAADPAYAGETWAPVSHGDGAALGRVEIVIRTADGSDSAAVQTLQITVDVPDDPVERVRVVRRWNLQAADSSSDPPAADVSQSTGVRRLNEQP